ncbi:putative RNA-binding signal recognition particle 68 [Leishmania utingensis]|uniref:Signal recognition particle subunit SRP68 n=1 Tax=Leishmania utingensis TaxID=653362 RepID=A0AAW3AP09_9TRYP
MAVDFDLILFIKETQLQHGLRAEDYARYHHYITNRLATLRQQLSFSNDKKKFLHKEVTPQNATDVRHLMLLALYAERCWAEAESMQMQLQAKKESRRGDANIPKGGVPPQDQYRKRLNKSVKWAAKLHEVANQVASDRVKKECTAYLKDTTGRCHASHGKFKEAKEAFLEARETYATLRCMSSEEQWVVIACKMNELDDRVTYCMQRLEEDPTTYRPAPIFVTPSSDGGAADSAVAMSGVSQVSWNERTLNVYSIRVKDALREAQAVEVESAVAKVQETRGVVPVGQSNRVLDLMDRRINYYNDALAHARQDLRAAPEGASKTEYQLIVHYILFHVAQESLRRTFFLADLYSRRFEATERTLKSTGATWDSQSSSFPRKHKQQRHRKKAEVAPMQYASPLEVVRLFQAAAGSVDEMELLPGVAGRDDVEALHAVCAAGQLFFTGESWRVSAAWPLAMKYYCDALAFLREAKGPYVASLHEHIEQRLMQGAAEVVLTASSMGVNVNAKGSSPLVTYLIDADERTTQVAQGVVRFPPDYHAVPCKPVFVDIASTFVDYPLSGDDEAGINDCAGAKAASTPAMPRNTNAATPPPKKKGWMFGWVS